MEIRHLRHEANRLYGGYIDQGKELELLLSLLHSMQYTHGFIEIGAGYGGSFHGWGRVIPDGQKISIDYYDKLSNDPVEQVWGRRAPRTKREALWYKHFTDVHPLFAPSTEITLKNAEVDFLFIDGRWQDVSYNFHHFKHFIRPGGIIAVHCILSDRATEVQNLWREIKRDYPHTAEFAYGPHPRGNVGGTGVVFV